MGSQLPRGEEHQAERLLGQSPTSCNAAPSSRLLRQAVEDFLEVRLSCWMEQRSRVQEISLFGCWYGICTAETARAACSRGVESPPASPCQHQYQ